MPPGAAGPAEETSVEETSVEETSVEETSAEETEEAAPGTRMIVMRALLMIVCVIPLPSAAEFP
ncbi:MAG: hypothetical protein JO362_16755 [Streptomycetaceae bacterium]|nr:hypothetical protein [Streptomycetaceae bacterium]